ncbi:MAG: hypothetical protein CMN25_00655 [Salinicola sp.]|uniref:hypothetical protein n=1 Tax=uncultured Salinicola sp. TaxID=1193542 RepID=UPI000C8C2415|nr:hypothetical protein [uncultured Salinicola sp.]MAM55833.1 hypothetical protein [Salinicola sp.]|tara:strand:+ start:686 stop:1270 length:585 start_codon:yes stop_codon:yes gene_type:complete
MGWTVPYTTTSRDELVRHIFDEHNEPGRFEIIDHSLRGNVLYLLYFKPEQNYRFITVYLLSGPSPCSRREGDRGWGYKDMDESMHPYYYDCPERLLKQSDVQSEFAVAWREACRQHRLKIKRQKTLASEMPAGTVIQMAAGWDANGQRTTPVTFVRAHTATFFIGKDGDGKLWRYRWSNVVGDPTESALKYSAA